MDFSRLVQDEHAAGWIKAIAAKMAPYPYLFDIVVLVLAFTIGSLISTALYYFLERILLRFYKRFCELSPELLKCIRNMSFCLVSCVPPYVVIYCVWIEGMHEWIAVLVVKLLAMLTAIALALAITYGIKTVGLWYKQQRNAEQRPINGLLKTAITFVWVGSFIVFFSILLGRSPVYLLSGVGAVAAALLLFFQKTILSLVACVQVNTDHLVEIGDWIAMDADGVDGIVTEITLHTVKVRNWDMTIVCLPVCDLVNKPFFNYTAMEKSGGRRIKKAILIDQRSIRLLTADEVKILKGFDILREYLNDEEARIADYNSGRTQFNTRYLSNLRIFRIYAQRYLSHNPNIRTDMPLAVRALSPSSTGIPLEIYCFSREVSWVSFERVQSEILEHLLSVLPNFRLRVFQNCSDIYQTVGEQVDVVGGAFCFEQLEDPPYSANQG